jgi:hypothetical protein
MANTSVVQARGLHYGVLWRRRRAGIELDAQRRGAGQHEPARRRWGARQHTRQRLMRSQSGGRRQRQPLLRQRWRHRQPQLRMHGHWRREHRLRRWIPAFWRHITGPTSRRLHAVRHRALHDIRVRHTAENRAAALRRSTVRQQRGRGCEPHSATDNRASDYDTCPRRNDSHVGFLPVKPTDPSMAAGP